MEWAICLWPVPEIGHTAFNGQLTCLLQNLYAGQEQLEQDMEQWTGSKLGKEYGKAIYCHPAYLTYMQSTSCEMLGWMKHKLESRLLGEKKKKKIAGRNVNNLRYAYDTILMAESEEELKPLDECEGGE